MTTTDEAFQAIADGELELEANHVLDSSLGYIAEWVRQRRAAGEPCGLADLIRKINTEPNSRATLLAGMCAAMWRLMPPAVREAQ